MIERGLVEAASYSPLRPLSVTFKSVKVGDGSDEYLEVGYRDSELVNPALAAAEVEEVEMAEEKDGYGRNTHLNSVVDSDSSDVEIACETVAADPDNIVKETVVEPIIDTLDIAGASETLSCPKDIVPHLDGVIPTIVANGVTVDDGVLSSKVVKREIPKIDRRAVRISDPGAVDQPTTVLQLNKISLETSSAIFGSCPRRHTIAGSSVKTDVRPSSGILLADNRGNNI